MTDEERRKCIDNASLEDLLRKWRTSLPEDPMFQGDIGTYYQEVMTRKRNANPDEWVAASKRIRCRTEIQTPIEMIEKALVLAFRHVGCYEDSDYQTVPNARVALEDVEALVKALGEATEFLHLAVLTLAIDVETEWGKKLFARLVTVRQHNRAALAKFQVEP